ncbi:hypothetical protein ISF_09029 [Cordyceps fumosorosea ARSEF 2679]|uniref:Uncharacterized protein n=1 Tax=Cordyceps fumosorosea (strain ARSEF 2679) TaxID=1081104 RepID=A0A162I6T7_CORFA|nr:hypothetical protein ISF_09029 [Cordyceps fumosorosea ARSEF 2679]OAA53075.1 hypothetical protein ISF_09029 [Cordyceps fumosorosea ARSEF 2679]
MSTVRATVLKQWMNLGYPGGAALPVFDVIGTDAFQEADVLGISRGCTKWNVAVRTWRSCRDTSTRRLR